MSFILCKHSGKHIEELDSSYLLFIIESDFAEWSLINACKQELSARLKLDWQPPTDEEKIMRQELIRLIDRIHQLESLLVMATICKGNQIILDGYAHNPALLQQDIKILQSLNI